MCSHPDAIGIVAADDREGAFDLAAGKIRRDDLLHLVELAIHEIDADPVGARRIDRDDAAILVGDQFVIELGVKQRRQRRERDRHRSNQLGPVETPAQRAFIAVVRRMTPAS